MYSALELSKYIVTKCINDGKPISNLQLQKILYYIQRDFLNKESLHFQILLKPGSLVQWCRMSIIIIVGLGLCQFPFWKKHLICQKKILWKSTK